MAKTLIAITGASSGIGAAFARRLAPEHDLLLIARRRDKLEALSSELAKTSGCQAEILVADLADETDTAAVAERLASDPNLVLLVNNAGFGTKGRFWESPLEIQEQMHRLHVMATVRLTHAALKNLAGRNSGGIINVASVAAFMRSQGSVSYCATKTWMNAFTEGLYLDLKGAGSKVRVQAVCPGFTYSEFHDTMGAGSLCAGRCGFLAFRRICGGRFDQRPAAEQTFCDSGLALSPGNRASVEAADGGPPEGRSGRRANACPANSGSTGSNSAVAGPIVRQRYTRLG